MTARITDDLAGNAGAGYSSSPSQISFVSPSGQQSSFAMLAGTERISGSALDGVYQFDMTVAAYAEQGTWTVRNLLLVDQAGNSTTLNAATLGAAGYPTTFEVVRTG